MISFTCTFFFQVWQYLLWPYLGEVLSISIKWQLHKSAEFSHISCKAKQYKIALAAYFSVGSKSQFYTLCCRNICFLTGPVPCKLLKPILQPSSSEIHITQYMAYCLTPFLNSCIDEIPQPLLIRVLKFSNAGNQRRLKTTNYGTLMS